MARIQRIDNLPAVVNEGGTLLITGTLTDETGTAIPSSALDSMTLTLYDLETDEIINAREDDDISADVDAEGNMELVLLPADNPIQTEGTAGTKERHVALIKFAWDSTKADSCEIQIDVRRIHRVGEE